MSTRLKPYATYRDTGAEWLGRVPSHWSVLPHRAVFREIINKGHPGEEMLSVTIERGVVKQADLLRNTSKKDSSNEDKSNYKLVHPGDIAYNKMRAWQGALGVSQFQGIVSPAYIVVRPRQAQNTNYYHHLMRTPAFTTEAERWSYGITSDQWSLRSEDFKCIQTLVPPPDEQAQIVRFIRHLDQRVNRLIKTKRRLIELLNEQKQAIIHRAVTRGLDPTVPLKPSGIDWLGDVPSNWNLKRFKFVTHIVSGQVDPRTSPFREMVLVAPNHIEKATGSLIGRETADEQGADSGKYLVKRGQVIYSKIRPNLQKATIAQEDCLCSADMYPIQPRPSELSPDYLLMLMLSKPFTQYVVDCSMRVAMPKVNRDALGNGWLWYPDLDSQTQILEFISSEGAPFDQAIARSRSEIDFIREYRTRLVADVVTGQLDVRHLDLPQVEESLIEAIDAVESDDPEEELEAQEVE